MSKVRPDMELFRSLKVGDYIAYRYTRTIEGSWKGLWITKVKEEAVRGIAVPKTDTPTYRSLVEPASNWTAHREIIRLSYKQLLFLLKVTESAT
jgi:hypothetical protein